MQEWMPDLGSKGGPRYLAIAESIRSDIAAGRLAPAQRLPAQRQLARLLGLDFTTVARGYAEAQRRGLIESRVGEGTFVTGSPLAMSGSAGQNEANDFSMNMPPEPGDFTLWTKLGADLELKPNDLVRVMRYQRFGGTDTDKHAAIEWLAKRGVVADLERIFVVPGAHAALMAAIMILADKERGIILAEALTYPGVKAIAEQLGLQVVGVPIDQDGLSPSAFSEACVRYKPKAVYLNPTLSNPTTRTIPAERRQEIAEIARINRVPILEDDPYSLLSDKAPPAFASIAPDITWHIATLSKCLGAGLRVAYVIAPDVRSGWTFASAVRAANVMVSPITATLATRWIKDGTADDLVAAIRKETRERQALVASILPLELVTTNPASFHAWLSLPPRWSRSAFVGHMTSCGLGVVASDVFATEAPVPEAVRLCLGGPAPRSVVKTALEFAAHALSESPTRASRFL